MKKKAKEEPKKIDVPPPAASISYFAQIRLRHHSGQLLASAAENYSHTRGSKQQIVGAVSDADDSTWWLVRPHNGGDFEKKATDFVKAGDVIRLQHVSTGRNLHSHSFAPPQCPDQHEVSAYGEDGAGNHDDDWIVETRADAAADTGALFLFKHVTTGHYLHSHDDRHFEAGQQKYQEVTAFDGDDSNNDWQVVEIRESNTPPTLHSFATIGGNDCHQKFSTAFELKGWLESEKEAYSWLLDRPANAPSHDSVGDNVENGFSEIGGVLDRLLSSAGTSNKSDLRKEVTDLLESYYGSGQLLPSADARFQFARKYAQKDPNAASHALAYFLGLDPENSSAGLKGTFAAFAFENGLAERAQTEADSLSELKRQFEKDIAQQKTQHAQVQTAIDGKFEAASRHLADHDHAFTALLGKSKDELTALFTYATNHTAVKDAVTYWEQKAEAHRKARFWLGWAAGAVGTIVVGILALMVYFTLPGTVGQKQPDWWQVGVSVIIATFGIWAVRVLVQLLYSNVHLMADARERAVMVNVYLSMLRDQQLPPEPAHKLLILQSLFRPAASGVVKDDGSPTTWLDFVATKLGGSN